MPFDGSAAEVEARLDLRVGQPIPGEAGDLFLRCVQPRRNTMHVNLEVLSIPVADADKALDFYRDRLGWRCGERKRPHRPAST
jgi:hypothetical protein